MNLSKEDVQILLNYMEGHDYAIGIWEDHMIRKDLSEEGGEVVEYTIDEVIDTVCEWNYVIFSVNFINYCLNKVIKEEGYNELRATTH